MWRRLLQERYLAPVIIQVFGGTIVVAILAYGFATKNATIVLAVLGFAGSAVMVGGYYERANHDVKEALRPSEPAEVQVATREADA